MRIAASCLVVGLLVEIALPAHSGQLTCQRDTLTASPESIARHPPGFSPSPNPNVLMCQRTIGGAMRQLFDARATALRKCWSARYKGGHANQCPDPGDTKAEAKIAKATSKARARICEACGGADRDCGGGDDLTTAEIGFPQPCPDVGDCAGAVTTLDDLVDCATCDRFRH